jgi:hypothetical protein
MSGCCLRTFSIAGKRKPHSPRFKIIEHHLHHRKDGNPATMADDVTADTDVTDSYCGNVRTGSLEAKSGTRPEKRIGNEQGQEESCASDSASTSRISHTLRRTNSQKKDLRWPVSSRGSFIF